MRRSQLRLLFWGLLSIAIGLMLSDHFRSGNSREQSEQHHQNLTDRTQIELSQLIEAGHQIDDTLSSCCKVSLPGKWRVYAFDSTAIRKWSTNEWIPDSSMRSHPGVQIVQHPTGWELVLCNDTLDRILAHPLVRLAQGSFEPKTYLHSLEDVGFEFTKIHTEYSVWGDEIFLSFFGADGGHDHNQIGILIALILLLICLGLSNRLSAYSSAVTALIFLMWRMALHKGWLHSSLHSAPVFDPKFFASSSYLPSLGDLILHIAATGFVVIGVVRLIRHRSNTPLWVGSVMYSLLTLFILFAADLIRGLIVSLVMHSNISFDVTNLSSLNRFTAFAAVAVLVMLLIWMRVVYLTVEWRKAIPKKSSTLISVLAILAFVTFQMVDASRTISGLIPSIILCVLTYFIVRKWGENRLMPTSFLFLVICTVFFTQAVYVTQQIREQAYLEHYASKLILNKDLEAEYRFKSMENELVEEFLQPEDFEKFDQVKDAFEKRLRRLYFSGYMDRYNMLIISFDSAGNNINSTTRYSFEDLNYLYNFQAFPTLSNHFYQVKSNEVFNGYLAKFENCDLHGHYGNIFILLEPKFIQSSYEYPQLAQKRPEHKIINLENYSYAIYNQNKLVHQKGNFSYDLILDSSRLQSERGFGMNARYKHFISHQEDGSTVVLSQYDNRLVKALSTFSFSFTFFALILLVLILTWWLYLFVREKIVQSRGTLDDYQSFKFRRIQEMARWGVDQVFLSTRIRFAMMGLVLVGLLISLYVTIQFIQVNDQRRSENELMYKIREVANQIQNEVDIARKLRDPEARQLIVNEIGDVFKVEATLFDRNGFLLASSVEDLYENHLLAPVMQPDALSKLKEERSSQIVQVERLRNVWFTSAYIPLLDERRQVIAYLNLPYFSQQDILDQEISSYTVTFVNLYLFLLIVAFALALIVSRRISKPLQIIRDKMSRTGYGTRNELIEWHQNDEIGRLVQQYNKMVVQLADSAEKLSASEREGAWKEMARQVAHEIKNPLTPMKLNIQHLQRAWADGSDKLEDTFKRVTHVLIEQIEGLSRLASEFSNFANMPVDDFEVCNLSESILNNIVLFEKTDNIFFHYGSLDESILVYADKNHLNRIFSNLFKNAIQAIPADRKGKIDVSIKRSSTSVDVRVSDNGSGIAPENQAKIFVPNFSTKTSGMGLGLAITRKMIEAMNGSIRFETKVGKGTTFYLTFPIHQEENPRVE
ncbi:MAG: HAMP domain-containing histidine kinase [Flavobacteriales bacterium]|nr:HAMP domain-containing histidine kinase [Flavobacteriales bacterium]